MKAVAEENAITLSIVPTTYLESIVEPLRASFDRFQSGKSEATHHQDPATSMNVDEARQMIPDSYDLCPCASGKKYKFCCKVIFREIVEAMAASEEGDFRGALAWMDKAKEKVGETSEVLCRYAIVHCRKSENDALGYLTRALEANPKHPRTHFFLGFISRRKASWTRLCHPTKQQ